MEDKKETSVEKILSQDPAVPPVNKINPLIGEVNPDEDNDNNEKLPDKAWYVINTFGTRENAVKEALEKRAKSMNMEDKIIRIIVANYEEPVLDENGKQKMSKQKDPKTGKFLKDASGKFVLIPRTKEKNFYPGYIFVEMIMTDETWFVVRNTPGVSGITGSSGKGAKPFPIPREEIEPVLKRMHIEDPDMYSDYKEGDTVKLLSGTFSDAEGQIEKVDPENSEVKISITLFGRPQAITAKFSEIEKVDHQSDND